MALAAAEPLAHPMPSPPPNSPFASEEYLEIIKFLKETGSGEKPRWEDAWRWEMSIAHTFLLGMLERMYCFSSYAEEHDDVANYLGYAEVALFQIHNHHEWEEEYIFPTWDKMTGQDIFQRNIDQHHTFSEALEATWLYIRSSREKIIPTPKPESTVPKPTQHVYEIDLKKYPNLDFDNPFKSECLRGHMDTYVMPLVRHMREEIDTLGPDNMVKIGKENDDEVRAKTVAHLQGYDPKWFLCSVFTAMDIQVVKKLLPMPFFVRRILVPFYFGPRYAGFWRYSPHPENLSWAGTA